MTLGEQRIALLGEHRAIRALGARALAAAAEIGAGAVGAEERLAAAIAALVAETARHDAEEERQLRGIVETADAWGAIRAATMQACRDRRRAAIAAASEIAGVARGGPARAGRVAEVVAEIDRSLDREEREVLVPSVFRDDIISVGFVG